MAIESIPNQVFRFESIEQSGLNNDTAGWDVLCQAGDTLAVQLKNTPCGENLLCDALGDELIKDQCTVLGAFTLGTDWTSTEDADNCKILVHTGAIGTATYDTSGGDFNAPCTSFNFYKIEYEVLSVTGGGVTPFFDSYVFGSTAVGTHRTTVGVFTDYIQAQANPAVLGFYAIGDITIKIISVKQVAPCYIITENWTSTDGVFLDHVAGNTDEISSSSFPFADSSYFVLNITVKNRTAGTLTINMGGFDAQTLSGNGTFALYFTTEIGGDAMLHIIPDVDFDGSIQIISSFELKKDHAFYIADSTGTNVSDAYDFGSVTYPSIIYKDWITWSFVLSDVLYVGTNLEQCFYLVYIDSCDNSIHTSNNKIKYSETTFEKTQLIQAYCSTEAFGFEFVNSDFKLYQRLPFLQISPKYPTDGEEYTTATGRKNRLTTKVEKKKIAWIDYVDETAHDCLALQINCDVFIIDTTTYYCPTNDYEPEWIENQRYNLAQSKFEIQKKTPVLFNKNR